MNFLLSFLGPFVEVAPQIFVAFWLILGQKQIIDHNIKRKEKLMWTCKCAKDTVASKRSSSEKGFFNWHGVCIFVVSHFILSNFVCLGVGLGRQ
jgi:hypothetical protein